MGLNRMVFVAGFATGYVLGTRAGREKYDQLIKMARATAEHPAVQQAAGVVQAQATGLAQKVGSQLQEKVPQMAHSAAHTVGDRIPGMKHKNGQSDAGSDGGKGASNGSPFAATSNSHLGPKGH